MDEQLQEDWLDAKLRDEAPYIDDAGFTVSVMQQLPAPSRSRHSRSAILFGITIVACLVAYLVSGGGVFLADAAAFLVAMPQATVWAIAGAAALVVMIIGASAAMSKSRDLRL